jgi:glycosyltransferase involved in cell wall biosynthesis
MIGIACKADAAIAISHALRDEMQAHGFERIVQIPNGVDTDRLTPVEPNRRAALREQFAFPPDAWVLLYAGRLSVEKGPDVVLDAWAIAPPQQGLLVFAGEGPLVAMLEAQAERLGVADSVRLLGHVPQIGELMGAADAFVLPSRTEGMSNALLEAMAYGLPVISTRVSGSEDVISDGVSGLLVDPEDRPALGAAIRRLAADPGSARSMAGEGRRRAEETLSLRAVAERYQELYQDILEKAPMPPAALRHRRSPAESRR